MANLLITNNLPNNEIIVYKEDGAGEIRIPSPVASPYPDTIALNCSAYLNYGGTPQPNKTWLICFKNEPYCLEMVDIMENQQFLHTLFRFSPIIPITGNDCEIKAQMGGIAPLAPVNDECKLNIINKHEKPCNVFVNFNYMDFQSKKIPPDTKNPNILTFNFHSTFVIEVYFTVDEFAPFRVKINIKTNLNNINSFTIRKFKMNETAFSLTHEIILPENINLTIEPDWV